MAATPAVNLKASGGPLEVLDDGNRRRAFIRALNSEEELCEETTVDITMESVLRFHGDVSLKKQIADSGTAMPDVFRKRPNYDNRKRHLFAKSVDRVSQLIQFSVLSFFTSTSQSASGYY